MINGIGKIQRLVSTVFLVTCSLLLNAAYAAGLPLSPAQLLPGSVLPERAGSNLSTQTPVNPSTLPALPKPQQQQAPSGLGAAAAKIKFKLTKVTLKGNTVYSTATLSQTYKNKIDTVISVAQLQDIVQAITNYYRNNGYILTRAILPPQHVANGEVIIQIIEGYIDKVRVIGAPHGAKKFVQQMGEEITKQRPLKLTYLEHYLLLANNIPGVQVKAVLEPSKTNIGASNLDLVTQTKTFSGYTSYDNYGTRYIGPTEGSIGGEWDSIFLAGDSTQFNSTRTTRGEELKFYQGTYNMPVGTNGARLLFSGNDSHTLPGYVLTPAKINGDAVTLYSQYQYPLIRSRAQNLTADASFNYIDSKVVTFDQGFLLYNDHLRTLRGGVTWDMSDSYYGANNATTHIEQGLEILGATPEAMGETGFTSRFGASGHFTKIEAQYSRLQQLGPTRFALYFIVKGQYAFEPLLATEQFAYGGVQQALGRGYDPAEIIGDRGLAGSLEFRLNATPGKLFMQAAQLFIFYDAGAIWNMKNVPDQLRKQSATSAGFGSRFYFTRNISGNVLWAQPLTRQVSALQLIGDGRQPRIFFSVTASV